MLLVMMIMMMAVGEAAILQMSRQKEETVQIAAHCRPAAPHRRAQILGV
jgi:hypothetical protein